STSRSFIRRNSSRTKAHGTKTSVACICKAPSFDSQSFTRIEVRPMNIKSLSEKGSDPLRRGQKLHENDSPPKGQTPFRIGSKWAIVVALATSFLSVRSARAEKPQNWETESRSRLAEIEAVIKKN